MTHNLQPSYLPANLDNLGSDLEQISNRMRKETQVPMAAMYGPNCTAGACVLASQPLSDLFPQQNHTHHINSTANSNFRSWGPFGDFGDGL